VDTAIAASSAGARVTLHEQGERGLEAPRWTAALGSVLADGYAPAPVRGLRLQAEGPTVGDPGRVLGRFFNERDFTSLVVYRSPAVASGAGLVVDAAQLRDLRVLDPLTGRTRRARSEAAADGRGRVIRVEAQDPPGVVVFRRPTATPGLGLETEEVDVERERGLTAEEIIARFQLLERDQEDRLERWTARGRIEFHFNLAPAVRNIDVSIDTQYFWERGGQLEWEQIAYYINGNKVRWKKFPELPIVQPEKVITLPLDLTLDRTYRYRLVGEDRVDGQETYVIAFEPAAADAPESLYRGRVWIDKESFARRKASVVQTNLAPPVLSNEEVDRFAEVLGPDGDSYWMFSSIDGQQVWSTAGRSFVVRREVLFSEFEINPSKGVFDERRGRAYASDNRMLRETDQGFRYLDRGSDGTRTVRLKDKRSQWFGALGAFKDGRQDNVVPLAGVNYFNFNLGGSDIQFNAFFAGVIGFVTASKPGLGKTRQSLTADAGFSFIKGSERIYEGGEEVEAEQVEDRNQNIALRYGVPLGQFWQLNLIGGVRVREFFESDDGTRAINDYNTAEGANLTFVLPEDHFELRGTLQFQFNRRGYNVTADYTQASRSDWEAFGLLDQDTGEYGNLIDGTFVPTTEPVRDSFARWRLTAGKEWYLRGFHKVRGALDLLDGADMDRFSRYQFSFFGRDRLAGFSGSGVRFDEGAIGRFGYSFNILEVVRLDATVESAVIREDLPGAERESFSGFGISANLVGPWKTVINLDYGYALASDVPDLEGQQEFLLFVLKLF
jgi:hypothetical protein